MNNEKLPPIWQRVLALLCVLGAAALIYFGWARFKGDFYPPDRSFVGPNLVAWIVQVVVILIGASLIYPPWRHAMKKFVTGHVDSIKAHVSKTHAETRAFNQKLHKETREHAEDLHAETREHAAALHAKLHARIAKLEKPAARPPITAKKRP